VRRHGPAGYTDYTAYKDWLRDDFCFRCVYCLVRERWHPSGAQSFSVDHVQPKAIFPDRLCDYDNLVYACVRCNSVKSDLLDLADPCHVGLGSLMTVGPDGALVPTVPEGELMIRLLRLNDPKLVEFRQAWVEHIEELRKRPDDNGLSHWMGFPTDLPKFDDRRPPKGNTRKDGLGKSWAAQKNRPSVY
jgi:hypothetical protein